MAISRKEKRTLNRFFDKLSRFAGIPTNEIRDLGDLLAAEAGGNTRRTVVRGVAFTQNSYPVAEQASGAVAVGDATVARNDVEVYSLVLNRTFTVRGTSYSYTAEQGLLPIAQPISGDVGILLDAQGNIASVNNERPVLAVGEYVGVVGGVIVYDDPNASPTNGVRMQLTGIYSPAAASPEAIAWPGTDGAALGQAWLTVVGAPPGVIAEFIEFGRTILTRTGDTAVEVVPTSRDNRLSFNGWDTENVPR